MLDLGTLRVGIRADTDEAKSKLKGFQEETKNTEKAAKDSSANIKSATKTVSDSFGKVATGVKVAGAAVGAAFVATSKSALDAYASYEQNLGGINKLFGDSAAQVAADAKASFITCGTSANTYMEQVTSFSASLISSLSGDTAKAAEYANTAMTDMSDNANTFGTSIEDIQHAYQGFAKSNFTMLDNLKLGYGGTKEEMQRLIDDANKVKSANGEMADLSIDKFSDMVEAIHIIQEQMNIAGTTNREALTTIEGSINATKAAWDNWLTGLGDDTADMATLTKNLVDMIVNTATLIVPRLAQIASTIIQEIPNIFEQIKAALPAQMQSVVDVVMNLIPLFAGVITGIMTIFEGLQIADSISKLMELFNALWVVLAANPVLAVVAAIAALVAAFATAYATNENFRNSVNDCWNSISAVVMPVVQSLIDSFVNFATQIGTMLTPVIQSAVDLFTTLGDILMNVLLTAFQIIAPYIDMFVAEFLNFATNVAAAVLPVIQQLIDAFNQFAQFVAPIVESALSVIQSIFAAVFPYIQTIVTTVFSVISTYISTVMSVISAIITAVLAAVRGDWQGCFSALQSIVTTVFNGVKSIIQTCMSAAQSIISGILSTIKSLWDSAWNTLHSVVSNAMSMASNAVSNGVSTIVNWFSGLPGRITGALGNLGGLLVGAGKSIIDGLLSGLKSAFENVKSFVGGIGDWIAAHKGPKEYDLKLLIPNGGWIMESLATGLTKAMPMVETALNEIAGNIEGYNFGTATVEASYRDFVAAKGAVDGGKESKSTTTITVNNYSPEALNEKESAREFRRSMRELAFA